MCSARIDSLDTYPEPHVSLRQLARYWQVDRRTVRKWIDNGQLPAIRLAPTVWRIKIEDARAFERSALMRAS
jgi:excisionase family DNA binding protein